MEPPPPSSPSENPTMPPDRTASRCCAMVMDGTRDSVAVARWRASSDRDHTDAGAPALAALTSVTLYITIYSYCNAIPCRHPARHGMRAARMAIPYVRQQHKQHRRGSHDAARDCRLQRQTDRSKGIDYETRDGAARTQVDVRRPAGG